VAGAFLFLPLPAKPGFDRLVTAAESPGTAMVPAAAAVLSLTALKPLDKDRRSHIADFNFDEALGLLAGLNVLPKESFATDHSYRTGRDQPQVLWQGWVKALAPVMFPGASGSSLDLHPIPYRGGPSGLDRHDPPRRGIAGPSALCCCALEQKSRCLCDSNADLTRADQDDELMRFVEFWHTVTGTDPQWLDFDSRLIDYAEMSRVNQRKIHFITTRRRGAAIRRRLQRRPASDRKKAVLDTPRRCHQQVRCLDEAGHLRGYGGPIRQIAVSGLGRDQPAPFLSNDFEEAPRELILRYAGRNRIEDGWGISVNFFHLDCLASEVRLDVDLDAALTVIANGCYRWLASRRRRFEKAAPKQLYRRCVEAGGTVEVQEGRITVSFERRSHNPLLREAALDREPVPIPGLGGRPVAFTFR
jgi:hypothetical protein